MDHASRRRFLIALASIAVSPAAWAGGFEGVGVVLVHGKGGGTGPLQPLAAALKKQGALVSIPLMSWRSSYRTYDATLDELGVEVARLRQRGARKIVLAGHSMGANLSLGYSAARGGIAGVVALAPGHRPEYIASVSGDSPSACEGDGPRRPRTHDRDLHRFQPGANLPRQDDGGSLSELLRTGRSRRPRRPRERRQRPRPLGGGNGRSCGHERSSNTIRHENRPRGGSQIHSAGRQSPRSCNGSQASRQQRPRESSEVKKNGRG